MFCSTAALMVGSAYSMKSNALRGFVFLLMATVAVAYWMGSQPKQPIDLSRAEPEISAENPMDVKDFALRDVNGKEVRLSDFKGRPILLNFWAAWCPPCVDELPSLLKLSDWAGKEFGLVTVAVSADPDWKAVDELFRKKNLWPQGSVPLTILLNSDGGVGSTYGSTKYPETFFISRDFKITRKFVGIQNWTSQEMTSWITENSKAKASASSQ